MDYPLWLQIILALCMGLALAGLGAWLFCTSATKAIDAANKLSILISLIFGIKVGPDEIAREGITRVSAHDIRFARESGYRIKLLASAAEKDGKVNARTAFKAMKAGDEWARHIVDEYVSYLAVGITNMINIFQPDVLCVGGGICKEGDTLLVPLQKYIEAERYSQYTEKQTALCVAKLGNDAGVIGAACLID